MWPCYQVDFVRLSEGLGLGLAVCNLPPHLSSDVEGAKTKEAGISCLGRLQSSVP